jgi:hypothetical protein
MNTATKTSDITSTTNFNIALLAVVTEPLVEVWNKIYICVSYVLSPRNQRRNKRSKGKSHLHVRTGLISILVSHVREDSNSFFWLLKTCRLVGKNSYHLQVVIPNMQTTYFFRMSGSTYWATIQTTGIWYLYYLTMFFKHLKKITKYLRVLGLLTANWTYSLQDIQVLMTYLNCHPYLEVWRTGKG